MINDIQKRLIEICKNNAVALLKEFKEFYPFAFGISNYNEEVHSVNTLMDTDTPKPLEVVAALEKALTVSHKKNSFIGVAICIDVLANPPYMSSKIDALQIRVDVVNGQPATFFVPYKWLGNNIEFLELYTEEGVFTFF